jgi:hypothetical protein
MTTESGREHERLAVLVGTWRTEGSTIEPAVLIRATDAYEWLPGGFGLLHTVDARVGDERVEGAEIIGWDPARGAYTTLYFGSDGPNAYQATLTDEGGALVWRMQSASDRFTGAFGPDGDTITGRWERLEAGGTWAPWMEITLTRRAR